ncbi:DUF6985 domain-containing protein [Paenibacillus glacialis]|uniref:DUF6985 domain-containing protein n=1 Tax=Paenibacillus glacialis TaxID=494026 RepID=A0A168KRW2_9BACL|nr:hypothetical protein [Paenibacillus glacialis]OAB42384.1 hypothetical protein PGLA_11960 [Paenibacillus glacialis]
MLLRNIKNVDGGLEGEVYFKIFNKYISFSADEVDMNYVEKCANYLNALPDDVIDGLSEASIRYCNAFLDMIGEEAQVFENARDVFKSIYPSSLNISAPEQGDKPVIDMELNCTWEEEHGMQWIVRDDKVLYVGAYNGEDPWGDYTEKDEWNYA